MRKFLFLLAACLVAVTPLFARDYTFDLKNLDLSQGSDEQIPGGVNIFIRMDNNHPSGVTPNLYAWDGQGTKLLGEFPGKTLTEDDLKFVSVIGNDGVKTGYYMYHFDGSCLSNGNMGIVISSDNYTPNSNLQSKDIYISCEGNYFYEYNYYTPSQSEEETNNYVTGGKRIIPESGTNIFVREMNSDNYTYNNNASINLHAWNSNGQNLRGDWPGAVMNDFIVIDGVKWYYWHTDNTSWGGIIFSHNGNDKTPDIDNSETNKSLKAGDNFYTYKPHENWDNAYKFAVEGNVDYLSSKIPLKDRTNNFKLWGASNKITMTSEDGNFRLTFNLGNGKSVSEIQFDKTTGRLELPQNSLIKVESLSGDYLNEVILGPLTPTIAWGKDEVGFSNPKPENYLHDWVQTTKKGEAGYYHLSNIFRNVLFEKTVFEAGGTTGSNMQYRSYFIGPEIYVRDERISAEDLTFSDHNVKQNKFLVDEGLIGVDVFEGYLIARSENYISAAHKHKPATGQKILKVNGSTPAYANPNTQQYSWIALKIDNPSEYIGAKLTNVRGMYCGESGATNSHHGWMNPTIEVESFEVASPKGTVETTLNTYCTANFSEQDKKNNLTDYTPEYFFMEPRHWEICNVVDVMRTPNQTVYAPTENALMPAGKTNYYAHYGIEGSASLQNFEAAWAAVDEKTGAAYLTYNHVFKIDHAIALTQDWSQSSDTRYDYPLDTPNPYYEEESAQVYSFFLWGMPDTKLYEDDSYTNDAFATADLVYFSRYDVENDNNVYKNDLRIMLNKIDAATLNNVQDLIVTRRDRMGDNPVTIATLKRQAEAGKYKVEYVAATQTAINNVDGIMQKGDTHYTDASTVYDFKSTDPVVYMSDRFVSSSLTKEDDITAQNDYYQYRVEPGEGTPSTITCVVNGVPVYKNKDYNLTRAEYTKEAVDNDLNGDLEENKNVDVAFTATAPTNSYVADMFKIWRGADYTSLSASNLEGNLDMSSSLEVPVSQNDTYTEGQNYYVPTLWTEYNDNTYGSYKRFVSDATIALQIKYLEAASVAEDGKMPCLATLTISSSVDVPAKDTRYLIRIWREVNGVKTLLNGQKEVQGKDEHGNMVTWTNYDDLKYLAEQTGEKTIYDVFRVKPASTVGLMDVNIPEVKYYATLYVEDTASSKYYVKKENASKSGSIPTAITTVNGGAQVESVRYYNVAGIESEKPFAGMNIVVTRYSDGTTTTTKVVK